MFCQECGCQNRDDVVLCRRCGTPLESGALDQWLESVIPEKETFDFNYLKKVVKPKKSIKKWVYVFAGELILILILFFSFVQKLSNLFSAEHVAERYFISLANGRLEEAYSMLELGEGDFTDFESYQAYKKEIPCPGLLLMQYRKEARTGYSGKMYPSCIGKKGLSLIRFIRFH